MRDFGAAMEATIDTLSMQDLEEARRSVDAKCIRIPVLPNRGCPI